MPRRPAPWYRSEKRAWYVKIGGRQVRLGADKAGAFAAFHRLMAAGGRLPVSSELTARDVFNLFLDHTRRRVQKGERAAVTLEGYERFLVPAAVGFGTVQAEALIPATVAAWVDGQSGWGVTTRHNAITAIKAAFRWAKRSGHLALNPIADLERPTPRRREVVPTPGQAAALRTVRRDAAFRDLVAALVETGCRPGEVCALTAAGVDLDAGTWTVPNKTRHRTGEPTRTVHLTPAVVDLSRRLAGSHPDGPIFRNSRGRPWTRNAIALRFQRLRTAVGLGPEAGVAYALRHLYVTDALERGVPVATLAELVGHRDATMILRVYSKLASRHQHLREAAATVRPASASASGPESPRSDRESGPSGPEAGSGPGSAPAGPTRGRRPRRTR